MLFAFLANSKDYIIEEYQFRKIKLEHNDLLTIYANEKQAIIHVQPHFFLNPLLITVAPSNSKQYTIQPRPNDLFSFDDSTISIQYHGYGICRITFWLIDSSICSSQLYHASSMREARVSIRNKPNMLHACWFLDFPYEASCTADVLVKDNFLRIYSPQWDMQDYQNSSQIQINYPELSLTTIAGQRNENDTIQLTLISDTIISDWSQTARAVPVCDYNGDCIPLATISSNILSIANSIQPLTIFALCVPLLVLFFFSMHSLWQKRSCTDDTDRFWIRPVEPLHPPSNSSK